MMTTVRRDYDDNNENENETTTRGGRQKELLPSFTELTLPAVIAFNSFFSDSLRTSTTRQHRLDDGETATTSNTSTIGRTHTHSRRQHLQLLFCTPAASLNLTPDLPGGLLPLTDPAHVPSPPRVSISAQHPAGSLQTDGRLSEIILRRGAR